MEPNIKNSFIPRDTANTAGRAPRYRGGGSFDLILLLGIVIFVASVALGIGVFLYLQFLQSNLSSKIDQLARAQAAFEPALIAELTRLDERMAAAETILHNHTAPSELFHILEDITLDTVAFDSMIFTATGPNTMTMVLTGLARSVNSIALQADLFGRHSAVLSPIFSNINRDRGGVTFDVEATLNPSSLRYTSAVEARRQPAAIPQEEIIGGEGDDSIPLFNPGDENEESGGAESEEQ